MKSIVDSNKIDRKVERRLKGDKLKTKIALDNAIHDMKYHHQVISEWMNAISGSNTGCCPRGPIGAQLDASFGAMFISPTVLNK